MLKKFEHFVESIIQTLDSQPELVKVYILPILLFLLDFCLRAVIHVDLIDAGADMAFLATASFITVLVEDIGHSHLKPFVLIVLLISFMLPWIFCLWGVSNTNPFYDLHLGNHSIDAHIILFTLSWFVGLSSLIISGAFVHQITIIGLQSSSG